MNTSVMLFDTLVNRNQTEEEIKNVLIDFSKYDVKEQFPFELYSDRTVLGKRYSSTELKGDKTRAYFVYKALTIEDRKGEISDKQASSFDPDNSGGKCDFMKKVYSDLWGFEYNYGYFGKIDAFPNVNTDNKNKTILWGADCLNSMQTSINALKSYSTYECLKQMAEKEKTFIDEMKKSEVGELFQFAHAPGNFGLVPAYFNGYRGRSTIIKDYLPQSLYFLKINDFPVAENLSNYTRNSRYMNGKAENYFEDYSQRMFKKYINTMFLWDLVCYDESNIYVVDYEGNAVNGLQDKNIDIKKWAKGAQYFIRRRGIFMAALLWARYFSKEEYEKIVERLYSDEDIRENDEYGYKAVFRMIEKTIKCDFLKKVFTCAKKLIEELN